jgi:hypothetical protein
MYKDKHGSYTVTGILAVDKKTGLEMGPPEGAGAESAILMVGTRAHASFSDCLPYRIRWVAIGTANVAVGESKRSA